MKRRFRVTSGVIIDIAAACLWVYFAISTGNLLLGGVAAYALIGAALRARCARLEAERDDAIERAEALETLVRGLMRQRDEVLEMVRVQA